MTIRFSLSVLVSTLALAAIVPAAQADERSNAVAGALIGGAAGAVIGHRISGRDGAVVGGALGAATGVAVATSPRDGGHRSDGGYRADAGYREPARDAYVYGDDDDEDVDVRTRVVYDEPEVRTRVIYRPAVVYRPAPVVVYRDAPVYYQPVRQVVRYDMPRQEWRGRGGDDYRMKEYYKWRRHHDHGRGHDRDDD